VRYVDDCLLFTADKSALHVWKKQLIEFAAALRLRLHEREIAVFPVTTGIPFLVGASIPITAASSGATVWPFSGATRTCANDGLLATLGSIKFRSPCRAGSHTSLTATPGACGARSCRAPFP
jgi:hypothetical protein